MLGEINKERANVTKRTQLRIAQLLVESEESILVGQVNVAAQQDQIPLLAEQENWHCCLNTICFCVLLLLLNLLFCQWLYYQTVSLHQLKILFYFYSHAYVRTYTVNSGIAEEALVMNVSSAIYISL